MLPKAALYQDEEKQERPTAQYFRPQGCQGDSVHGADSQPVENFISTLKWVALRVHDLYEIGHHAARNPLLLLTFSLFDTNVHAYPFTGIAFDRFKDHRRLVLC